MKQEPAGAPGGAVFSFTALSLAALSLAALLLLSSLPSPAAKASGAAGPIPAQPAEGSKAPAAAQDAGPVKRGDIDIAVKDFRLLSDRYSPEEPIRVAALVSNGGAAAARNVAVSFFLDGSKYASRVIPLLEAGARRRIAVALPAPPRAAVLEVIVTALPGLEDLGRERTPGDNGARLAVAVTPRGGGRGDSRSVMWLTEPLYVVDAPFRVEPGASTVPLLVMIVSELPNEEGWDPDLDTFNSIKLWINGRYITKLEDSFTVPDTRFWYRIYQIPLSLFDRIDDFNLVRVNLDRAWADDRGPDIQPQNSAWGEIIDPMTGEPLDNATLFTDGDYWYCRVFRSSHRLPNVDRNRWFYGDTHHHTVYTDNSAEMGSPVFASAFAARAMGLKWLCVTDHSNDYDSDEDAENFKDGLPHPPFARPQPRSTTAKWNDFLSQAAAVNASGLFTIIAGSEVNFAILKSDFPQVPDDIFAHTLVFGLEGAAAPLIGEGQDGMALFSPIGKDAEKGASGLIPANNTSVYDASRLHGDTLAMWELLDSLQATVPGAAVFIAHPIHEFDPNSVSWTFLKQRNPWYETGGSCVYEPGVSASYHHPLFKGFQVWNGAYGFGNGIGRDESQVLDGMAKYDSILQQDLADFDPSKKLFVIGGSDAHGDFNSYTSRGENYNWNIMQKRRDLVHVLGKVRTAVYIEDGKVTPAAALDALARGRSVMTNGPMAVLTLLFDGKEYLPGDHLSVPRSRLPGLTLRFRWSTSPEFGPFTAVTLKVIGPSAILAPVVIPNPPDEGRWDLAVPGHLPGFAGWYALRVEGATDPAGALCKEPDVTYPYRCYANPVWLEITGG